MTDRPVARRQFLKGISIGATGMLAACSRRSDEDSPPNVILIITDDQGYGDLGCHGNPVLKTPYLDQLYRDSHRLTDYHVDPTCAPTRSALLTGRYSSRTGVWHTVGGRSFLRSDETTMAEVFRHNGYRTGIFGKWHLGDNYPYRPQDRGFDEATIHGGGGVGQSPDHWDNDYFDDTYLVDGEPRRFSGYCTDIWFDSALEFIERNPSRPFFCYIPTNAPHTPFNVSEKYAAPYRSDPRVPTPEFYGMVANIDENVGRLLNRLESLGLAENTILIFTTDNGSSGGVSFNQSSGAVRGFNSGMRGKKGSEYEGGHRVPFMLRWPAGDVAGGVDVDQICAHIDILPTLIDLCRLAEPTHLPFDGRSLRPLLQEDASGWQDRTLFVHSQRIENPEKWRRCAVMKQNWRLVNGRELYNIEEDPGQQSDLAQVHPPFVRELREAYERWWTDISVRFAEYCYIVIGSSQENPSTLTCHDLHDPPNAPIRAAISNTSQIRDALPVNGFWALEVAEAGEYEFELRRWPKESGAGINASIDGGKAIDAVEGRLKIGELDISKEIRPEDVGCVFRVSLRPGKMMMQTWLIEAEGTERSAYYVYVKRL